MTTGTKATIELTDKRQLFIDDYLVERMSGVERNIHAVNKDPNNPVMNPELPWEGHQVLLFGTVLRDDEEGIWKMWYFTYDHFRYMAGIIPEISHICYAVSDDGVKWKKPRLGVVDYRGTKENNIVLTGETNEALQYAAHLDNCTVVKDPHDPDPSRRYKMMIRRQTWDVSKKVEKPSTEKGDVLSGKLPYSGIYEGERPIGNYVLFSADGIRWREHKEPVMVKPIGDTLAIMYDTNRRKHVAYVKQMVDGKRARFLCESDDFIHWSNPQPMLAADEHDPEDLELYHNSGFNYEDMYLGFMTVWHREVGNYLDVQLISSRDGIHWSRVGDRSPIVEAGRMEIDWDCTSQNVGSNAPIRVGDELRVYYCGRSSKHLHAQHGREPNKGAIGIGRLRLDGFVSLDAGEDGGEVLTRLLNCSGSGEDRRLVINADATGGGSVTVELVDEAGQVLPGYTADICLPLTGDAIRYEVSWSGRTDLSAIAGKPFRIRFQLRKAALYSFQIGWL